MAFDWNALFMDLIRMGATTHDPLYQSVDAALRALDCDIAAAGRHGTLCSVRRFDVAAWLEH
jgi:hypothetical protein